MSKSAPLIEPKFYFESKLYVEINNNIKFTSALQANNSCEVIDKLFKTPSHVIRTNFQTLFY